MKILNWIHVIKIEKYQKLSPVCPDLGLYNSERVVIVCFIGIPITKFSQVIEIDTKDKYSKNLMSNLNSSLIVSLEKQEIRTVGYK